MHKRVREREINLWDMLFEILLHWRKMLCVAIIFAVIVGVFGYVKSEKSIDAQRNAYETVTIDNYNISSVAEHRARTYMAYEAEVARQSAYNLNAGLMSLDPNHFYAGRLVYYVDANVEKQEAIAQMYSNSLHNEQLEKKLAEIYGDIEEKASVMELVGTDGRFLKFVSKSAPDATVKADVSGMFSVYVYAAKQQTCLDALDAIETEISSISKNCTEVFGKHTLTQTTHSCVETSSGALLLYQNDQVKNSKEYMVDFANMQREMTGAENQYITLYQRNQEKDQVEPPAFGTPSVSAKYVVLGFVLGIVLICVLQGWLYVTNEKLRLEDSIEDTYKVSELGAVLLSNEKKKRWFAFVDQMLTKLRHVNHHYFEENKCVEMVASNLKIWMNNHGKKKLFITGAWMEDAEKQVAKKICDQLKQADIQVEIGEAILYHAKALEDAAEIGVVVLVEQTGKTLYGELSEEIALCEKQQIEVVGIVTVTEGK